MATTESSHDLSQVSLNLLEYIFSQPELDRIDRRRLRTLALPPLQDEDDQKRLAETMVEEFERCGGIDAIEQL